ncbi:flagellin, partial [Campylobacter jejuni]|nr:flagellin [Campylobacter jejuni]
EASVSLRESKGQIDSATAAAMGFDADKMQYKTLVTGGVSDYMTGHGYSEGSGKSIGSGQDFSKLIAGQIADLSTTLGVGSGAVSTLMDSTFSDSGNTTANYSTMAKVISTLQISTSGWAKALADGDVLKYMKASVVDMMKAAGGFGETKDQSAGVTTLKGAMAVMDIAETATTNLDQIRADIGSVQNQLQVTINNITVTQVNVKAAESTIRDVDFASESANFSKYNILAQSGSYAMSQANAVQQNVLKLLQ